MFGQDNQNDSNQQDSATPVISPAPDALLNEDPVTSASPAPSAPAFDTTGVSLDQSGTTGNSAASDEPAADDQVDEPTVTDTPDPTAALPSSPSSSSPSDDDHLLAPGADDDLIHIKQDALQQLSPLVNHLEQTPEEKFRTTMMMIQASDDQSLVKTAYDAAKEIKDDKVRAQALLDIINEINYFTQQQNS